ncbi:hypothetical protein EDD86DRAFT_199107 [Gorgonomyces haynaldii]|nr:hypothetical protein EDD86DRAFT_199107 [Gorgonomyces haynaldii]
MKVMWISFTFALSRAPNSFAVQLLNTATNLVATGLFGQLLFEEKVALSWWIGACLMLIGSLIIISEQEEDKKKTE